MNEHTRSNQIKPFGLQAGDQRTEFGEFTAHFVNTQIFQYGPCNLYRFTGQFPVRRLVGVRFFVGESYCDITLFLRSG